MSDETTGPLSFSIDDAATVETTVPVIQDGTFCKWKVASYKEKVQAPSEKSKGGKYLEFVLDLQNTVPTTTGGSLKPGDFGSKFFHKIYLYDQKTPEGQIPERAKSSICGLVDAVLGTGVQNNPKGRPVRPAINDSTLASVVGQTFWAKMKAKTGEYHGNEISLVLHESDMPKM